MVYFSGKGQAEQHEADLDVKIKLSDSSEFIDLEEAVAQYLPNVKKAFLYDIFQTIPAEHQDVEWMLASGDPKTSVLAMVAETLHHKFGKRSPYKPSGSFSTDLLVAKLHELLFGAPRQFLNLHDALSLVHKVIANTEFPRLSLKRFDDFKALTAMLVVKGTLKNNDVHDVAEEVVQCHNEKKPKNKLLKLIGKNGGKIVNKYCEIVKSVQFTST